MTKAEHEYVEVAKEVKDIVSNVNGVLRKPLADRYAELSEIIGARRCENLQNLIEREYDDGA